jgi:hypothetical protein
MLIERSGAGTGTTGSDGNGGTPPLVSTESPEGHSRHT